jgi:hypothetical protein
LESLLEFKSGITDDTIDENNQQDENIQIVAKKTRQWIDSLISCLSKIT